MDHLPRNIQSTSPQHARKRGIQKNKWKQNINRKNRYSSKGLPELAKCQHKKNETFKCSELKIQDISRMHRQFYKSNNKIDQDNFILQNTKIKKCARTRLVDSSKGPNNFTVEYYVTIKNPRKQERVCKSFFLQILKIGKDRVTGVLQRSFKEGGDIAKENRGGNMKIKRYEGRKNNVKKFIESLKGTESHYCRSKSSRLYLPPELNITKLWKLYQNNCEDVLLKVKQSLFRNIFNSNYNVGFGSPVKDACSNCIQLIQKIKTASTLEEKNLYITERRVHSLKAKAFYNLLRNTADDNTIMSLSFDCQKNNPLPKLPDQAAYFSRQINLYNFTVVVGTSKSALDNVHTYYWTENEHPKSSNEISSAVFHTLNRIDIPMNIKKIKLFADGCGGQNKNTILVGMCTKWLHSYAPSQIKQMEIIFPIVGHSFLPPDRVFALIEKETKKKDTICNPEEYVEIFKKFATVYHLGDENIEIFDCKKEINNNIKPPGNWHFGFNKSKRFILKRGRTNISVQGEENYNCEIKKPKYVTKRGKTCSDLAPNVIKKGNRVNLNKISDVSNLLTKHFGENWRQLDNLRFYLYISENNNNFDERPDLQCVLSGDE